MIRNSLYNRREGLHTVFGAVLGSFSIKTLSVLGLALLLMHSPELFQPFKVGGAGFLMFLGAWSLWRAYGEFNTRSEGFQNTSKAPIKGPPLISGYLMSMANPMSSVRFIALFSTAITPEMPLLFQLSYLIVLAIISLVFYMCMALFFSTKVIQEKMTRYRYVLSILLGITLIYWGIKILQVSFAT